MIEITVNGERQVIDVDPAMPLLWALRDVIGLRGAKYGCGVGACGACTVHVDGVPVLACVTLVGSLAPEAKVATIEGQRTREADALIAAWRALDVAQCGFCQPGQIMRAAALLAEKPAPTDAEIVAAMDGNLCRCATYPRIKAGIAYAAARLAGEEAVR